MGRLWLCLGAQVAGILCAGRVDPGIAIGGAAGGLTLALVRRRRLVAGAGLVVCVFGLAALGTALRGRPTAIDALASHVPDCDLTGRVLETAGALGSLVAIDTARCEGFASVADAGIVILEPPVPPPGSAVELRGLVLPLRTEGFDVVRRRAGAHAWMHEPQIELLGRPTGLFAMAAALRSSLRSATARLDPPVGGLLEGLSIGRTDRIDPGAEENLRRAGLAHLVAVSGSNVALVLACALALCARLALLARVGSGLLALLFYVVVVGPEPSVLRAGVMGGIALVALGAGRRAVSLQTLALALVAVLAFRPQLVGSVGLQLSAAATAGIVLWAGDIQARVRGPRPLALVIGGTVAAQLAVAPILVGVFGELSVVAPLANVLAIPAVAPATVLGLGAGVVGLVSDPLAGLLAAAAAPFAAWILAVGGRLGAPEWAALELPEPAWVLLAAPLSLLVAATVRRDLRRGGMDGPRR